MHKLSPKKSRRGRIRNQKEHMMQPEDVDNIRIYKAIALSSLIPQL